MEPTYLCTANLANMNPKLSVNVNKVATLRNARGGNNPDVIKVALDCEAFGADGITVHPRPDERHIRYDDVRKLSAVVTTEFNIEGYPSESFLKLVMLLTTVATAPNLAARDAPEERYFTLSPYAAPCIILRSSNLTS